MKNKVRFYRSVNFKIALTFILILFISIEIIGAYFIRGLERSMIENYKDTMNTQAETLSGTISTYLNRQNIDIDETNNEIQRILDNSDSADILEMRVVDEKGIIRATTDVNDRSSIGKKSIDSYIDQFTDKSFIALDETSGNRVLINIRVLESVGDVVVGSLYIRGDLEKQYQEISNIALIFVTATIIAIAIAIIVSMLVARSITQPIGEMREQALRIAKGDYSHTIDIKAHDELGQLAETFNQLAERIEETQEAMEAERNRLDSVLTYMTDGVIATDRRGRVIMINEMALSLLNLKQEESIGESVLKLLDIEESYTLRSLLENTEEMLLERSSDVSHMNRLILRVDFSMIRRESGFISGLVAVLHDVTEQEKTEQERRDFVSNVSHELRTPLTSMRSYIEALHDGAWKDGEIAPHFLEVTLEETDRMIRMINDLLSLSKLDSGNAQLQLEFVNFNNLVNFVLDRFDMMVNNTEKSYKIQREFTKRDLWLEIDTDRIIQVIDNIMNNAIKYSPDGGTVTVRLIETHNHVILSVSDQGMGIPRKDLAKIFDRFYRVDKARARQQGGTGLGLAISRDVLKAHGGSIWAESRENYGSTFFISLPYEPYEEEWWD
ncbi:cell wall metabolism sensor histidine kinase WalK [Enterococcus eurekensis]|uniref:histidine kinase n=1 Tax=Enterococcus eurekensis TaxID=1159753 RepID=A0ABV9M1G9_9ENTE